MMIIIFLVMKGLQGKSADKGDAKKKCFLWEE